MRVRLRPGLTILDPKASWVVQGITFDAEWAPGWPRHPRGVLIFKPRDPSTSAELSIDDLEVLDDDVDT